ncbi:MAG TPA: zinc-binding dehydrogenase [Dehalococcoidia bacterium]|nr:zinc-binding dehydrogenase [Dehalococcoidia bacterium]
MKTRAAIQLELNGPLVVDEIDLPQPDDSQVVVKQFASGICHSQLHQMHNPASVRPLLLGHESTGVVIAKGKDVSHVKEGDHVMVTWVPRDGYEGMPVPTQGSMTYQGKTAGWQASPTWVETTVAHEQYVVKMPDDVATDVTAIIGCAVMTGVGAAINTAKVEPGSTVAIYGVGGVGLCVVVGCVLAGAKEIIAVDLTDEKLAFAREFGVTQTINASREDPVEKIKELTNGGADYAFDAIGRKETMEQVLPSVKQGLVAIREGGTAILVGVPQVPATLNMRDIFLARTYKGTFGGSSRPETDYPKFIQWFREGKLDLNKLVTSRFKLDQINEACNALQSGQIAGRAILTYDS